MTHGWTTSNSRPGIVNAYYPPLKKAVRIGVFDIGNIPPDFVYARESREGQCRQKNWY